MGNAQQLRVDKSKDARFVDQPGQILGTHRDVAARDQLAQAPAHLPGSKGRRLSRFQRLTQLRQASPLKRVDHAPAAPDIVGDSGQRLISLMRNGGCTCSPGVWTPGWTTG